MLASAIRKTKFNEIICDKLTTFIQSAYINLIDGYDFYSCIELSTFDMFETQTTMDCYILKFDK